MRVHLLNRTVCPAPVTCGKQVSRPSQYTVEPGEANCPDCADAHPALTYEQRNGILENAQDAGYSVVPGFKPQPFRERRWPAPWEKCKCGRMQSRSWDGWFAAGNALPPPLKWERTVHAPERHGGCAADPVKEKKPTARKAASVLDRKKRSSRAA